MSIEMKCPGCRAPYTLPDSLEGKKVRCKKCERTFLVQALAEAMIDEADEQEAEATGIRPNKVRPARIAARPTARSRFHDDDEEEGDRPRPRRRPQKSGNAALFWILGGVAAAMLILAGGGVAAYVLMQRVSARAVALQTQSPPPAMAPMAAQAPANPAPQPAPAAQQPAPAQVPPAGQQPAPAQQQPAPGNNQGNQPVVVLSNGRIGRGIGPQKSFTMSYRFEKGGPTPGVFYFLVIKSPRGDGAARFGWHEMQNQGVFEVRELGFARNNDPGPYEAYLEMGNSIGRFGQRTRISNTIALTP